MRRHTCTEEACLAIGEFFRLYRKLYLAGLLRPF